MAEIKLPDYKAWVGNEIYLGEEKPIVYEGKKEEAISIARLIRFKMPTQDETVEFIRRKAHDLVHSPEEADGYVPKVLQIMMNPWIIWDISEKGKNFEHLRNHYECDAEGYFLTFARGKVPKKALGDFLASFESYGTGTYASLMQDLGTEEWGIALSLPEPGRLPDFSRLEDFLLNGTIPDSLLSVEGENINHLEVRDHIIDLYNSLNPLDLSDVNDASYESLELASAETIESASECISKQVKELGKKSFRLN